MLSLCSLWSWLLRIGLGWWNLFRQIGQFGWITLVWLNDGKKTWGHIYSDSKVPQGRGGAVDQELHVQEDDRDSCRDMWGERGTRKANTTEILELTMKAVCLLTHWRNLGQWPVMLMTRCSIKGTINAANLRKYKAPSPDVASVVNIHIHAHHTNR